MAQIKLKPKISVAHSRIPFVLGLVGGIISAVFSIIYLTPPFPELFGIIFGIIGIVSSGFILYGSILLKTKFKLGSRILIVASIIAILPGGVLGPLISLVGGILTHVKKRI